MTGLLQGLSALLWGLALLVCTTAADMPSQEWRSTFNRGLKQSSGCNPVDGFTSDPDRDHDGDTVASLLPGTAVKDLATACLAMQTCPGVCNGFNSVGELKSNATLNSIASEPGLLCFYTRNVTVVCDPSLARPPVAAPPPPDDPVLIVAPLINAPPSAGTPSKDPSGCETVVGYTSQMNVTHQGDSYDQFVGLSVQALKMTCDANCPCKAFTSDGDVKSNATIDTKNATANLGGPLCYYTRLNAPDCGITCATIDGYIYTKGVARDGDTIRTLDAGSATQDVADACSRSCQCRAFNSEGQLKSNETITDSFAGETCFYTRINTVVCDTPANLIGSRVLIHARTGTNQCWTRNTTAPPAGWAWIGTTTCRNYSHTVNDQVFQIVNATDAPGYVYIADGRTNGTQCLGILASGSATGARHSLAPCIQNKGQQYALQGRSSGGYYIVTREFGMCLRLGDNGLLSQIADCVLPAVEADNIDRVIFDVEQEKFCPAIAGASSVPGNTYLSNVSDIDDVTRRFPRGESTYAQILNATVTSCNNDCSCIAFDDWGVTKYRVDPKTGEPTDVAGFNSCFYMRPPPKPCCPLVQGYILTTGVGRGNNIASIFDVFEEYGLRANNDKTLPAGAISTLQAACEVDCACAGFDSKGYLYSDITPITSDLPSDACLYKRNTTAVTCSNATTSANATQCVITTANRTCTNDPRLYNVRVRLTSVSYSGQCLTTTGALGDVPVFTSDPDWQPGSPSRCLQTSASVFDLYPTGNGYVQFKEQSSQTGRCLKVVRIPNDSAGRWLMQVAACDGGDAAQQFLFRRKPYALGNATAQSVAEGIYEVSVAVAPQLCLKSGDLDSGFSKNVLMGACEDYHIPPRPPGGGRPINPQDLVDFQRWTVDIEKNCTAVPGYSVVSDFTRYDNNMRRLANWRTMALADMAKACDADCKCQSFSNFGWLKNNTAFPTIPNGFSECYYIRNNIPDCNCPPIPGFNVAVGQDRVANDDLGTISPVPDLPELGARCRLDCTCNGFNSKGVLKKGNTTNTLTGNPLDCYYYKPQNTTCLVACPNNLACITRPNNDSNLPKFTSNLPALPMNIPGQDNLLDLLDPQELVGVVKIFLDQPGSNAWAKTLATQALCATSLLPIFSGAVIKTMGFLGPLSNGSCENMQSVLNDRNYVLGALSTEVLNQLPGISQSKKDKLKKAQTSLGDPIGVCLAVDPCNLDFHLGFAGVGAAMTFPLGPLPSVRVKLLFKGIAYSNNGDGAGITRPAFGLWTKDMTTLQRPAPTPILGNFWIRAGAEVSWGLIVGTKKIIVITAVTDLQMVVRTQNPVRFAMQIITAPKLELFDGIFVIDFAKMNDVQGPALSTALLFYTEHYDDKRWNVYAAAGLKVKIGPFFAALAGPLEDVIKLMFNVSSEIGVDFNMHLAPDGGGIRLVLYGRIELSAILAKIVRVFFPNAQTVFDSSVGVKISMVRIRGQMKAFGFVAVNGREFSAAFCNSNDDCMDDQACYLFVCTKQVACLGSYVRPIAGGITNGVCPSNLKYGGTPRHGRCYQNCKPGYEQGMLGGDSVICWEGNCDCGTEVVGSALCSPKTLGMCITFWKARRRDWYNRVVELQCAPGQQQIGLLCYPACRPGYAPGDGSASKPYKTTCYVTKGTGQITPLANGCPPQFPQGCGSPVQPYACVDNNNGCGIGTIAALFKQCYT